MQVHDGLYSVCGQCFAGKKAQKMMCQSLTHRKKVNIKDLDSFHEARQLEENSAPPAGDFRPENLTYEEWQLIQMARQEKRQVSQTSSSTSSDIA